MPDDCVLPAVSVAAVGSRALWLRSSRFLLHLSSYALLPRRRRQRPRLKHPKMRESKADKRRRKRSQRRGALSTYQLASLMWQKRSNRRVEMVCVFHLRLSLAKVRNIIRCSYRCPECFPPWATPSLPSRCIASRIVSRRDRSRSVRRLPLIDTDLTGCVTCKVKRLKCGEEKPGCQQCARRSVECGGYKKDFKWRPFEESNVKSNIDRLKRGE